MIKLFKRIVVWILVLTIVGIVIAVALSPIGDDDEDYPVGI